MTRTAADTDWRARALAAEAALAEARAERARLWQELHALRARERDEDYYRRLHTELERSLSWRLTRPLRAGKAYAEEARRRLKDPGR